MGGREVMRGRSHRLRFLGQGPTDPVPRVTPGFEVDRLPDICLLSVPTEVSVRPFEARSDPLGFPVLLRR